MWACALGHLEAAVLLFRWNRQALSIPDSLGRLPLSVAQSRGHVRLARCLEELQRQEASLEPPLALSPPSSSPDTGEGRPRSKRLWVGEREEEQGRGEGGGKNNLGGVMELLLPLPLPCPCRAERGLVALRAVGWHILCHISLFQRPGR